MKIALSPCPNDTFLFRPWLEGVVGQEIKPEPVFADIENLNAWAIEKRFILTKLSFPAFKEVASDYQWLPVGTALGFNCGPLLIGKTPFALHELSQKKVAIPGRWTSAHHLLNHLLLPPKEKLFCLYHQIGALIESGRVDCGLIIHEQRFTFAKQGFVALADLGELWHSKTGMPLPLGGLAVSRRIPRELKEKIVRVLQLSLQVAQASPEEGLPFILRHSREQEEFVVKKHIATYVNDETANLSAEGCKAILSLFPKLPSDWLFS